MSIFYFLLPSYRSFFWLTLYYVQNEWSHSLLLNSVQARQRDKNKTKTKTNKNKNKKTNKQKNPNKKTNKKKRQQNKTNQNKNKNKTTKQNKTKQNKIKNKTKKYKKKREKKTWTDRPSPTENNYFDNYLSTSHIGITQWCSQVVNIGEVAGSQDKPTRYCEQGCRSVFNMGDNLVVCQHNCALARTGGV